jgi:hypothetical protein
MGIFLDVPIKGSGKRPFLLGIGRADNLLNRGE